METQQTTSTGAPHVSVETSWPHVLVKSVNQLQRFVSACRGGRCDRAGVAAHAGSAAAGGAAAGRRGLCQGGQSIPAGMHPDPDVRPKGPSVSSETRLLYRSCTAACHQSSSRTRLDQLRWMCTVAEQPGVLMPVISSLLQAALAGVVEAVRRSVAPASLSTQQQVRRSAQDRMEGAAKLCVLAAGLPV